ncbi:hypothetical protein HAX54_045480 [Datura stramonium]|uniref:Uncharacterized protein n=1 Tax=Datura stramonium TaxID=4076 RepID=A0ABS8WFU3_DATST|nr:hypothetical protein [Datura stramonium]
MKKVEEADKETQGSKKMQVTKEHIVVTENTEAIRGNGKDREPREVSGTAKGLGKDVGENLPEITDEEEIIIQNGIDTGKVEQYNHKDIDRDERNSSMNRQSSNRVLHEIVSHGKGIVVASESEALESEQSNTRGEEETIFNVEL